MTTPEESPNDDGALDRPNPSSRERQQPLYLRMYFQEHLTALVRLIGYRHVPFDDARQQIETLFERFGRDRIIEATDEVLVVDNEADPAVVRLTDEARKIAFQLLGRPPEGEPEEGTTVTGSVPHAESASTMIKESQDIVDGPDRTPLKMTRHVALHAFRTWLVETRQPFVALDAAKLQQFTGRKMTVPDFVLPGQSIRVICLRTKLTAKQARELCEWREMFGERPAIYQVWRFKNAGGWQWEFLPVTAES